MTATVPSLFFNSSLTICITLSFYFYPAVEIAGDSDCFHQEIVPFSWLLLCLGSGNADTQQALENWPGDKMLYLLAPRVSLCRFSILTILNFG